ncbi:MAG TPA: hypothetical protein VN729_07905 [Ktedonobacteraceae bacterium]|nr:hypothetical protein [Ktedonobacteraceae bacterium]
MLDIDTLNHLYDLTAHTLYHAEVNQLPVLSTEGERELVARARQGDEQAKAELIVSCLRWAWNEAYNVCQNRRPRHVDQLDLAQVASLQMVHSMQRALTKASPAGYLRGLARREISQYCVYYAPLIHKPHMIIEDLKQVEMPVVTTSLDEPVYRHTETTLLTVDIVEISMPPVEEVERSQTEEQAERWKLLYQAIEELTPRQREYLIRGYGLYGQPAEANPELGATGERLKRLAVEILRKKLAPYLIQLNSPEVERE